MVPARDIVVVGASAGGVAAVTAVLETLPVDFPGALFIALHRRPDPLNAHGLERVLGRSTGLPVDSARDEQRSIDPVADAG